MSRNFWDDFYSRQSTRRGNVTQELEALSLEEKVAIGIGRYLVVNRIYTQGTPEQRRACGQFFRELYPLLRRLDVMPEDWDNVNKP